MLSETIKYLFLMFADPSELILDLNNFIFTTEAHLLPLSLGQLSNKTTGWAFISHIVTLHFYTKFDFRLCRWRKSSHNGLYAIMSKSKQIVSGNCATTVERFGVWCVSQNIQFGKA